MPLLVHEIFVPLHLLHQALKGYPKVNFWVSVGYRSGYRSGECLGPGNFDNRTRAVQEHASTTFNAAGSAETFFALLCATHAYNRTHVYYSSIRLRYRFWEFTVSVSMLSRHKHQHKPHMKGFLHEPFCLWLTCIDVLRGHKSKMISNCLEKKKLTGLEPFTILHLQ